jgi:tRNA G18 (ribose-2'-O)-methylase SpoU
MAVVRVVRVSGPDDPRVARYADIGDHDRLRANGLFVAEGRFVVERLLEHERAGSARFHVHSLLLNGAAFRALEPALATLSRLKRDVDVFVCDPGDFTALTGFNIHRGCLALARRPQPSSVDEVLSTAGTAVVLEHISNADNVGGIFRNAAAFDVDAVLLSPTTCDPLYRKAIRTSMAATLHVPFATLGDQPADWPDALAGLRRRGFHLAALTPRQPAVDLEEFVRQPRAPRLAILLGTEGAGVSGAAEAVADCRVRIPTAAAIDSLNVASAAGIVLHRLRAAHAG